VTGAEPPVTPDGSFVVAWVLTGLLAQRRPATGAGDPVDLGLYGAPIQFVAPDGVTIELGSGRRLVDTLEVRPHPVGAGWSSIADIDMEEYVARDRGDAGPLADRGLKAQAVAARTYAWYQMAERGTYERAGLATTSAPPSPVRSSGAGRWWRLPRSATELGPAVDETAGEVLLWDGAPILARYFSTSGGATRNNEDVFPSSGAVPVPRGSTIPTMPSRPCTVAGVFTRDQFDDLLGRGETLSAAAPSPTPRSSTRGSGQPTRSSSQGAGRHPSPR
jgi:hypothetical protein